MKLKDKNAYRRIQINNARSKRKFDKSYIKRPNKFRYKK